MNSMKIFGLGLVLVAANASAKSVAKKPLAVKPAVEAPLEAKSGSTLAGKTTVTVDGKNVTIKVDVEKAPPGLHAVHIHEFGDCSAPDGKSAGGHYNPTKDAHGDWTKEHHHLGDIGNLEVAQDGKGSLTLTTDKWALGGGAPHDITGRSIIVHEKVDDFTTQPTGNAGGRIACVVLGAPAVKAPAGVAPATAPATAPAAAPATAPKK
jgi:Cu-Zn family superoxide dismutase